MLTISEIAFPAIAVAILIKSLPFWMQLGSFVYHIRKIPTAPGFIPLFGNSLYIANVALQERCSIPEAMHVIGKRLREDPSTVKGLDEFGCFKFWLFLYPIIVITSPECASVMYKSNTLPKSWIVVRYLAAVIRGFFAMNGPKYRYHKKLLGQQFSYSLMERLPAVVAKNCKDMVAVIEDKKGVISSIQDRLDCFMIHTMLQSAMGFTDEQIDQYFKPSYINEVAQNVKALFRLTMNRVFTFYVSDFLYNQTSEGQQFVKEKDKYHKFANDVFEIAKLLDKEREVASEDTMAREKSFLEVLYDEHKKNPEMFAREDFLGEFKAFFAAGFESMVTTMSWLFYYVGNHPNVQEKAFKELNEIFESDADREVTMDDIKNMRYLEAVVKEVLRIQSVVPGLSRSLDKDYVITTRSGKSTFVLPKYTEILLYQYIIQRDPHHWPNPQDFDPDRFYETKLPHSHAFIAFSSGYRSCMGQKYAMVVMIGCISSLLRRYKFECMQPLGSLVGRPQMTLSPEKDVAIKFNMRIS